MSLCEYKYTDIILYTDPLFVESKVLFHIKVKPYKNRIGLLNVWQIKLLPNAEKICPRRLKPIGKCMKCGFWRRHSIIAGTKIISSHFHKIWRDYYEICYTSAASWKTLAGDHQRRGPKSEWSDVFMDSFNPIVEFNCANSRDFFGTLKM